jgi:hypothetical protein
MGLAALMEKQGTNATTSTRSARARENFFMVILRKKIMEITAFILT